MNNIKDKDEAGQNLLKLVIELSKIIATDGLIKRNQASMLANDGCIIKY